MKSRMLAVIIVLTMLNGLSNKAFATQIDFREKIGGITSDTPTYKLNNSLAMRQELEKMTSTEVAGLGGFGTLYVTYKQAVQEKKAKERIYYNMSILHSKVDKTIEHNKMKLAQIAAKAFRDVNDKQWYAHLIPSAVYYGMVSGYSDGTFKGSENISYAEFSSILGNYDGVTRGIGKGSLSGQWYSRTIGLISIDFANSNNLNKESVNTNISRGEVAMIIATNYLGEELQTVKRYDIVYSDKGKSYFNDSKSIIKTQTERYTEMNYGELRQWYLNIKTGSSIPEPVLAAMIVLKDQEVMIGDDKGYSNWNKDITRAEVLTLMYKLGCLD